MSRNLTLALALSLAAIPTLARADDAPAPNPASASAPARLPTPASAPASLPTPASAPAPLPNPASAPAPDAAPAAISAAAPDYSDIPTQGIGADLGLAIGGRVTPGGLRIAGHYLYQLSDHDWFDGTVAFTYGGGGAGCFHDRSDELVCEHGAAQGVGAEIGGAVRRYFAAQGAFRPFARVGIGVELVHYAGDSLSGIAVPVSLGGGVRVVVAPSIALIGQGELAVGVGGFGQDLGAAPIFGLAITAGVEFALQ